MNDNAAWTGNVRAEAPGGEGPRIARLLKSGLVVLLVGLLAMVAFLAARELQAGTRGAQPGAVLPAVVPGLGRYMGSIPGVVQPLDVAFTGDGRIYVTEAGGEVRIFDAAGAPAGSLAAPAPGGRPAYVAVGRDGTVYVSDLGAGAIRRYSASGDYLGDFAPPGGRPRLPLGLAVDGGGNLYVTDVSPGHHRVLVFDPGGSLLLEIGREGGEPGEFRFPNDVAVDGQGRIYVSDGNNARVQVFGPQGDLQAVISVGSASPGLPRGIAIDHRRGLLFVVDALGQQVEVHDITGDRPVRRAVLGAGGNAEGFAFPNGVALDGQGHLYVTDRENGRVQLWSY